MKQLCIFLSVLFLLFACATKRKTKEVEKTEIKTENVVKNDSVFELNSKVSKIETNQTFNEFESILKALNVQYDGEQGNDLKVILNRTEKGTELNVSGKGKANYNENTEKVKNLNRNDVVNVLDSIIDARVEQYKYERAQQLVDSFKSEKENNTTGFQFGAYLTGFGVLCLIIFLVWISWQLRLKYNQF
ncbi:hypothetical protein HX001_00180 [Empedobacter brevis]|uniref:Lipoprotein n=1 Tax=Empedobacter brevis TaxID=247 RepID=A0AAJ1QBI7_9FLAO|nr:hypothetical protein [Empedobacter brevis]MDM1070902.1 hypothetical protein [Empedobacter brevis]